jgi:hypothetical protein
VELRPTPDVTSIFPNNPNNSNLIQITPNNTDYMMDIGPPPAGEVKEALLQHVSGRQLGGAGGGQPAPPGVEEYGGTFINDRLFNV